LKLADKNGRLFEKLTFQPGMKRFPATSKVPNPYRAERLLATLLSEPSMARSHHRGTKFTEQFKIEA